ncbi:MAG: hypothetical protein N2746_10800 [Deltaproteobacteria bacterium]|nr:hypothetical protein [Deltaproteobacteria bacterium]
MQPGFNHNIKYKDLIFHIQTEDNGEENPLIISHIFIGGNIIATKKTDYSHLLGKKDITAQVRAIMENQHKELIKELITGKYDNHPLLESSKEKINEMGDPQRQPTASMIKDRDNQTYKRQSHFKPVSGPLEFTVFGEGIISEESLDQVILKFLSENKNK